jgi:hypothetical protein
MKKIVLYLIVLSPFFAGATNYYVSNAGSDGNNGTATGTPWQTVPKVNAGSFSPGDSIRFLRGSVFSGTLYINNSGTTSSQIYYGAYGIGPDPIISGMITMSGWTNEGGNVYGIYCSSCKVSTNLVMTDGVVDHMARWPNTGYRTFTAITSSSFTDASITTGNYVNVTAVLKDERFCIDTIHTTSQSSGVFGLASAPSYTTLNGNGYFFENAFSLLDTLNEFYISPADTLYTFSADPITNHTIQVGGSDTGAYFNHINYVTMANIVIEGKNQYNFFSNLDTGIVVQNCKFIYSGNNGVQSNQCVKCYFYNDTIQYSNNNGVTVTGSNSNHWIIDSSLVSYNGTMPGMGHSGGGGTYVGINNPWGFSWYYYDDIGYNGFNGFHISASGTGSDSIYIAYTHAHHNGVVKSDGANCYFHDGAATIRTYGVVLFDNHFDHAVKDSAGVNFNLSDVNFGSYWDGYFSGANESGDTLDNNASAGIFDHGPNNSFNNNRIYSNVYAQAFFAETSLTTITGVVFKNNTIGYTAAAPNTIYFLTPNNDLATFGTFDYNYYVSPVSTANLFRTQSSADVGTARTLSSWETNTGYDSHSLIAVGYFLITGSIVIH